MKKLSILAATAVLGLWGCANTSKAREADAPTMEEIISEEQARESREDAPTVYDTTVSGDSGTHSTVTTPDGQTWDVQEEPGGDEPRTPADEATGGSGEVEADSEVIDEGPTDDAKRQTDEAPRR
ncbi:hypothetical protein JQX13_00630 [Archangium violaceum]|uniref:hypothetical protein n=1 Tax=Archangium violaceum TaxID=83451 RepID=UPI00193C35E6|nr:hypothetical protein [Archangium violaceum]QRK08728.1 hypothetical protein JQX13_00630 [Archangium violaceum]